MNIIQIIPGSGGSFYCGNCMRDSKYVEALRKQGHQQCQRTDMRYEKLDIRCAFISYRYHSVKQACPELHLETQKL